MQFQNLKASFGPWNRGLKNRLRGAKGMLGKIKFLSYVVINVISVSVQFKIDLLITPQTYHCAKSAQAIDLNLQNITGGNLLV